MTNSNSEHMRKLLNVISEDGPLAPGAFVDPLAAPDMSMDDPMDDTPTMGAETKIEVTMKDGDEVEVEVYAQQGDELSRLIQLAGQFHKDKQAGTLSNASLDAGPVDMAPDITPDMGMEPDMAVEPPVAPDMAPDMGMEPDISMDIPPMGGPDVPIGSEIDDIALDMDDVSEPEVDFTISDEELTSMEENMSKKHDFGYPNPMQGQEEYELSAFNFSGGANKPVRFVPARSGDNPMVDTSDRKGLREYINDVNASKKKDIAENSNDPKQKAMAAISSATSGIKIDDKTMDDMADAAVNTSDNTTAATKPEDAAKLALATAEADPKVNIRPNDLEKMKDNIDDMETESVVASDFKLPIVDEEELAERKRRYSFSHADFGRGIITSPGAKLKRSARRGLAIYRK